MIELVAHVRITLRDSTLGSTKVVPFVRGYEEALLMESISYRAAAGSREIPASETKRKRKRNVRESRARLNLV